MVSDYFKSPVKVFILFIILLGLAALVYFVVYKYIRQGHIVKPKLIKQDNSYQQTKEVHPQLYYVDLEYNPKTPLIIQKGSGKSSGDLPIITNSPLQNPPNYFTYKLEVKSDKGLVLQNGWASIPKEIFTTQNNTLLLRIYTVYEKGAIITLSLPDKSFENLKILWTGKIMD